MEEPQDQDQDIEDIQELLKRVERELRRLKADDQLAQAAPETFGRLADDVDAILDRRQGTDRRRSERKSPERRRRRPA